VSADHDQTEADERWRDVLFELVKRVDRDAELRARVEATGVVIDNFELMLERTRADRGAPSGAIGCRIYWWGFQLEIPHVMLAAWTDTTESADVAASIGTATNPAAPFRRRAAAYIASRLGELQQLDRGAGASVSMTWMAPNIFVPAAICGR
jgi:hypothetical protein